MRAQNASPPRQHRATEVPPTVQSVSTLPVTPTAPSKPLLLIDACEINFGPCPYGSRRKVDTIPARSVTITNSSESSVPCVWALVDGAFSITPTACVLEPHASQTFSVSSCPEIMSAVVCVCVSD